MQQLWSPAVIQGEWYILGLSISHPHRLPHFEAAINASSWPLEAAARNS